MTGDANNTRLSHSERSEDSAQCHSERSEESHNCVGKFAPLSVILNEVKNRKFLYCKGNCDSSSKNDSERHKRYVIETSP